MKNYVFVYGTLKRGYGNHRVLGSAKFVGEGKTVSGAYKMLDGGFPMVLSGGLFHVKGELFEVSDEQTMRNLDRLEGVPTLYTREETEVELSDGSVQHSYIYIGNPRWASGNYVIPNDNNECEWTR